MNLRETIRTYVKKGISLRVQQPGLPDDGPITPFLRAMSRLDDSGELSPVGVDLAGTINGRKVWVMFVHTGGAGAAPWRGQIILDSKYRGQGQASSSGNVGLVAHELAHVLQRDLKGKHWPGGGLRPTLKTRWVGDSTNYMEALSYMVGWTVEYDLRIHEASTRDSRLRVLESRLATVAGDDARNAARYVLKLYPDSKVYRQNHRLEAKTRDRRIPPGGWQYWLRQCGFSDDTVNHIRNIAQNGEGEWVDPEVTDKIAFG